MFRYLLGAGRRWWWFQVLTRIIMWQNMSWNLNLSCCFSVAQGISMLFWNDAAFQWLKTFQYFSEIMLPLSRLNAFDADITCTSSQLLPTFSYISKKEEDIDQENVTRKKENYIVVTMNGSFKIEIIAPKLLLLSKLLTQARVLWNKEISSKWS